ncbi:MAG: DUF368 domain-containing protein [Treponema sp.]|jgi:putative membrane protein|nr:DUF368 domain-containing protein [Treponema sp.]
MKKITDYISTAAKGLVVGSSMLVPGVSGGTTAIILGIYDKLIYAISTFFQDMVKNLIFLGVFCAGAGVGLLLFSRCMLWAVETWELPMMFLFLGAIIACVPMLYKQAKISRFNPLYILFAILGLVLVLSLGYIPKPNTEFSGSPLSSAIMLFITGFVIAAAIVLPGISTSHMLLILGMYNTTLEAMKNVNLPYLIPLALGGIAGIFLITNILEKALSKFPQFSYFMIIGFVLGSIIDVFPGFPTGRQIPICILTFLIGFFLILLMTKPFSFSKKDKN